MSSSFFDPKQPVDYFSKKTPSTYFCRGKGCKKKGVKLWRYSQMLVVKHNEQTLLCVDCACQREGINSALVQPDGLHPMINGQLIIDIGNLHPAIPKKDNSAFWFFNDALPAAVENWWRTLPLR